MPYKFKPPTNGESFPQPVEDLMQAWAETAEIYDSQRGNVQYAIGTAIARAENSPRDYQPFPVEAEVCVNEMAPGVLGAFATVQRNVNRLSGWNIAWRNPRYVEPIEQLADIDDQFLFKGIIQRADVVIDRSEQAILTHVYLQEKVFWEPGVTSGLFHQMFEIELMPPQ